MAIGRSVPAVRRRRRRRFHPLRAAALLCLMAGLFLIGSFAYGMSKGIAEQQRLNQVWHYQISARTPAPAGINPNLQRPVDGVDFAIRVPKLDYSAAVKEGIDRGVLYASPGHYPTTVWPGEPGTVGVAAHNVYWVKFPQLAKGDEIDIETRYGLYRYRVTGSEIVNPDNRSVLVPNADGYHLTMTTCWPLWAGAFAKQRFVIFATQVWPVPERVGYT